MSKIKLVTDPDVVITLDFLKDVSTPTSDGEYLDEPLTFLSGIRGDLQPLTGNALKAQTGIEPASTHAFLLEERQTGIEVGNWADDAARVADKNSGFRYRVTQVREIGPTYPQEIFLEVT